MSLPAFIRTKKMLSGYAMPRPSEVALDLENSKMDVQNFRLDITAIQVVNVSVFHYGTDIANLLQLTNFHTEIHLQESG